MVIYKILKWPFFGQFMVRWRNPLTSEQMKEWQKVSIKSRSGGVIMGLFSRSRTTEEKATIVLGHPMGKEAKAYFIKNGYTDLLRDNGFNTLIFDINGFGESTHGNFCYHDDIVATSILAKTITPSLPIGYHGISLGGQWATIAFADEWHQYDFAVIESAATTLEDFWIHFPLPYIVIVMLNTLMPRFKRKIEMIERIKEAKKLRSILFIYSSGDIWTPVSMGKRFQENCPIESDLWVTANAKHAMIMKSDYKGEYMKRIIDYFNSSVRIKD